MINKVLVTGVTPLSNTNEINCWDNRPFTTIWPEDQFLLQKSKGIIRTIKKKAKRGRTAFTTDHLRALERSYSINKYINTECRRQLSNTLHISEKCIKVWFQNRRMKEKKEASESSCDSSSEGVITPTPSAVSQSNEMSTQYYPSHYVFNGMYDQIPSYYQYEFPRAGYDNTVSNTNSNESSFKNDNNIHPTQYYPSNGLAYDVGANHYSQYSEMNIYWPVNYNNYL